MHYLSWLECSIQESRGWKSEGGSGPEARLKVSEDLLVTGFNCYAKESGLYKPWGPWRISKLGNDTIRVLL